MTMEDEDALRGDAEAYYEAYGDDADWRNFRDDPMPTWGDLPPDTQQHWVAVARAARQRNAF